jgi:hypothetical protein
MDANIKRESGESFVSPFALIPVDLRLIASCLYGKVNSPHSSCQLPA